MQLTKLLFQNKDILLLDEPTRNLSPLSNPIIRNILNNYKGTIISISHDRKFIQEVGEVIYILDQKGLHRLKKLYNNVKNRNLTNRDNEV